MPFVTHPDRTRAAKAFAVVCLTALAGCSSGGDGSSTSTTASASPSGSKQTRIVIKDFAFTPSTLTVAPGAKVTVVNEDSTTHTVTATDAKAFDTGNIDANRTVTFTEPSKSGTYPYKCTIHPNMKGSLTVR